MDLTIKQPTIDGLTLTPLKQIHHPLGDIFHGIKASEPEYKSFGEAYFSTICSEKIKGWKKHTRMWLNFIVPVGAIKVVIFDDRKESKTKDQFFTVELSKQNYQRLTIEPGLWVAFQGKSSGKNLLLNFASIEHDPTEALSLNLEEINYDWQ